MKKLTLYLTVLLLFSSCKIYKVHTENDKKKGIPFLTKTVQLEQQTTYQKEFIDVSLTITPMKDDSIVKGMSKVTFGPLKMTYPEREELSNFKRQIIAPDSISFAEVNALIQSFEELPSIEIEAPTDNVISNIVVRNIVVDEKVHYLNGRHRLFGSSNLDFELNSDNTLTKGNAESTSDVAEFATNMLTSVIPVSDIISKQLKLKDVETEEKEIDEKMLIEKDLKNTLEVFGLFDSTMVKDIDEIYYNVSLELNSGVLQFTFVKEVESYEDAAQKRIPFSLENEFFTVKEIKPGSETKSEKIESKEENAIQINGKVILPEN
jgi:hypothetical protein